ncbi:hypothetical protein [Desulfobacula sp.]|uniref:hypothetical protein n=1 Tax=Desulfobacula sp. TaxID=2593537 RepID=UPI001EC0A8A4|nr:hypothetical protein [Desulfobacula sp.]
MANIALIKSGINKENRQTAEIIKRRFTEQTSEAKRYPMIISLVLNQTIKNMESMEPFTTILPFCIMADVSQVFSTSESSWEFNIYVRLI